MSEVGEAIGTASEGGLLARAIDPKADFSGGRAVVEGACLNCGTELIGSYCHSCGQKGAIHRTIAAIWHELVHGVLHLDGKIWRTLPLLAIKPGELTRRYIDGQRARFVSPMAMFLFSVFFMFAVFQALGITTPTDISSPAELEGGVERAAEDAVTARDEAQAALESMAADAPGRAAAEQELKNRQDAVDGLAKVEEFLVDGENAQMTFNGTGIDWIDEGLVQKWRDNPGLMLYKMQTNSYKFSWLLIPISIPFVWSLFFWKRRFKAYDHAIFVTYSLAFMSLLFVTFSVLGIIGVPPVVLILAGIFIPPIHIYKQLRRGYELSRHAAFWRTAALVNIIVFVVTMIFLWLLLLLGAF